jgi:hypothetical protein
MSTDTQTNPLAQYVLEAQRIVYEAMAPMSNKKVAIQRLADLLCTPTVVAELMNAGATPTQGA